MVNNIEERVYELVRPYAGTYLFNLKKVQLTPDTDIDSDLDVDEFEAEDLMDKFFETFNVERGQFDIKIYYQEAPFSWNPFHKYTPIQVPDFTIGMLIESAKAGRWLY
ncbi:DUF1493 family protein [Erwinia tracheiphila]|uniref:DUF1493 family protein n=1 Tax=Erwinia tracheiphila TaxID=65700 RepID=A0A345CWT7_9GAMM|nr:DUF1493 family protein [Erwinia tracheiphila]AXF77904.1 DUF1493 family protein [Erwinia tracheiphila]UIA83388.1 DUF1493 family protein [Erwinia tracheiphila]UIA91968.1 DUF1493 family protein [Erwinia tracheiphila]